jgi:hypothetical protein
MRPLMRSITTTAFAAFIIPLLTAISSSPGAADTIVIVDDGKPRAFILTAVDTTHSASLAAAELQHFIQLMSGAQLPIYVGKDAVPENQRDRPRLLVGRSQAVQELGVTLPSGHDLEATREGFVLHTIGEEVVIAGNEDAGYRGTEYAVYELLEQLGCRWFFPGEFGQVIPQQKTISIPQLDIQQTPSFVVRNIWTAGWADERVEHAPWLARNKGSSSRPFAFAGDGSIGRLAPPELYAEKHPEIYAMGTDGLRHATGPNGEHHLTMLCVTNPLTVEIATQTIIDHFRDKPESNSYGFSAPDWSAKCYCDICTAADHGFTHDSGLKESISDGYLNFVNNVAHGVNAEYPDRYTVILAYDNRVRPPEGLDQPWNPNIIVQLARLGVSALRPIGEPGDLYARRRERTIKAWARLGPKMIIYDYDPHSSLNRMPFWNVHSIRENLPFYHKNGVVGFTTEGNSTYLRTGLNYYVRAKLMWDIDADVDAVVDDFHARFFGPAAAPMKLFYQEIETMLATSPEYMTWHQRLGDWTRIYPPDRTRRLGRHLEQAADLADTPERRTRVEAFRLVHEYMMTHHEMIFQLHQGNYSDAMAQLGKLHAAVEAAQRIQPGLMPPDPDWVIKRGSGLESWRRYIDRLSQRSDGDLGSRIALGPETGQFRTDVHDEGLFEQWHLDGVASELEWTSIPVTTDWSQSGYRDEQGYAYDELGWYRFTVPVAQWPQGKEAKLYVPLVYATKLWVWANGHLVHSPTDELVRYGTDIDVSRWLKPGQENSFTFRMSGTWDRAQRYGLADRWLLWSPTGS